MTVSELITAVRIRLDDRVGTSSTVLFPDDEIISYIDQVQYEIAEECRCISDTVSAFCTVAMDDGVSEYETDSSVLEIGSAVFIEGTTRKELEPVAFGDMVADGTWPSPSSGTPSKIAVRDSGGTIVLDKAPLLDTGTIRMQVIRLPVNAVSDETALEIPGKYHTRMINGILFQAYSKPDTETYSAAKRDLFLKLYERDKEIIRVTENRLRPKRIVYRIM